MSYQKRKYHELSTYEKFSFNELVQTMIDGWVEDIDKKLFVLSRFNLDPRDDVPMQFLMGVYQPEKITLPPPKKMSIEEAIAKFERENPPHPTGESWVIDQPIDINDLFKQNKPQEIATVAKPNVVTKADDVIPSSNNMVYSDEWIVMQNRLLHAISHLTLDERRLVLFLSPIIRKEIAKNPYKKTFTISVNNYVKEYNLKYKDCYKLLEKTVISIQKKLIEFWNFDENKKKNSVTRIVWVTKGHYVENMGLINLEFHEDIVEMLTVFDKANPFTKYQKDWITKLGTYGIILIELILSCMHQQYKQKSYTVDYLREKFDCVDIYPIFGDFRRYVINKAIKEIHEYTPIRISYTQKKKGRAVSELVFSFENTEIEQPKQVEQKIKLENKNKDPFVNFKMTSKQLAVFGTKIAKKTDKDIEIIIDEISNVHLQGQYVEYLKALDFIPSSWYTADEIKSHPTAEQIEQEQQQAKQKAKEQAELEQAQFRQDYEVLLANAEEFVLANQKRIGKTGIEKMYLQSGNYRAIVGVWERYLLDKNSRKNFAMLDEILGR